MKQCALPVKKDFVDIRKAPFHKKNANMAHCLDFALKEGTPIQSIASGKILATESIYRKIYRDPQFAARTNYVEVLHQDGTIGLYVHLAWRSIKVSRGQKVKRGQIIGLSGQTGYATYPHLHLGLYDKTGKNIPIQFAG